MTAVYTIPLVHPHTNPLSSFHQSLDSLVTLNSTINLIFSQLHGRVELEKSRLDVLTQRITVAESTVSKTLSDPARSTLVISPSSYPIPTPPSLRPLWTDDSLVASKPLDVSADLRLTQQKPKEISPFDFFESRVSSHTSTVSDLLIFSKPTRKNQKKTEPQEAEEPNTEFDEIIPEVDKGVKNYIPAHLQMHDSRNGVLPLPLPNAAGNIRFRQNATQPIAPTLLRPDEDFDFVEAFEIEDLPVINPEPVKVPEPIVHESLKVPTEPVSKTIPQIPTSNPPNPTRRRATRPPKPDIKIFNPKPAILPEPSPKPIPSTIVPKPIPSTIVPKPAVSDPSGPMRRGPIPPPPPRPAPKFQTTSQQPRKPIPPKPKPSQEPVPKPSPGSSSRREPLPPRGHSTLPPLLQEMLDISLAGIRGAQEAAVLEADGSDSWSEDEQ